MKDDMYIVASLSTLEVNDLEQIAKQMYGDDEPHIDVRATIIDGNLYGVVGIVPSYSDTDISSSEYLRRNEA